MHDRNQQCVNSNIDTALMVSSPQPCHDAAFCVPRLSLASPRDSPFLHHVDAGTEQTDIEIHAGWWE